MAEPFDDLAVRRAFFADMDARWLTEHPEDTETLAAWEQRREWLYQAIGQLRARVRQFDGQGA